MVRQRLLIITLAALAILIVGFGVVFTAATMRNSATATSVADIGGPFSLVDDEGQRVTEADLAGKPYAMFFGFTFCPDVCPTTLAELSAYMRELGPDADRLNYVFVTVDPERDTPEVLDRYVGAFDERIRGFTGTQAEVDAMVAAYKAYAERVPLESGGYTMNHTAGVYLMDAAGQFAGMISYEEGPDTALPKLQRLADGASEV